MALWRPCGGCLSRQRQASFEAAQSASANVARSRATPPPTFKVPSGLGDAAFQTSGGPGAVVEYRGSMFGRREKSDHRARSLVCSRTSSTSFGPSASSVRHRLLAGTRADDEPEAARPPVRALTDHDRQLLAPVRAAGDRLRLDQGLLRPFDLDGNQAALLLGGLGQLGLGCSVWRMLFSIWSSGLSLVASDVAGSV